MLKYNLDLLDAQCLGCGMIRKELMINEIPIELEDNFKEISNGPEKLYYCEACDTISISSGFEIF